jgi:hypothetical protein
VLELATCRLPNHVDVADILALLATERTAFRKDAAAAKALIAIGDAKPDAKFDPIELASWTMVANLILNLDEVVTK